MEDFFVRWPRVQAITGLSRTSVWRREKAGRFSPKRRSLGGSAVGWLQSELTQWQKTRVIVERQS